MLSPAERFSPSYYRNVRYKLDPTTGRIVEERGSGMSPVQVTRYSNADIQSAGLGDPVNAGGGLMPSQPRANPMERAEPGDGFGEDTGFSPAPEATGNLDDIGGVSTVMGLAGLATGFPGLGLAGNVVDTIRDKVAAEDFDPEYEGNLGKWGSSFINDLTGGLLGRSHYDRARDEYRDRTGTGLNDAALDAARNPGRTGYSGPKGVATGRDGNRTAGGQSGEQSRSRARSDMESERGRQSGTRGGRAERGRDRDPQRDSRDIRDSGSF